MAPSPDPRAQPPRVAKIKGASRIGNILYISGQIPQWEGELRYVGKIGREFDIDDDDEVTIDIGAPVVVGKAVGE